MQIEDLKLLSTAESLGTLSLLERALETEPGTIASFSIPPFVAAVGESSQISFRHAVRTILTVQLDCL